MSSSSMAAKDPDLSPRKRGTRITPRTCLWPLAGSLVITFGLSIGLTFRSNHHCYAGTCGEWLFPLQARLHVVIWYAWLSLATTFLAVRAFHPEMQKVLARCLITRKVPLLDKRISLGGALMVAWILSLYGVVVGVWWIRLRDYFNDRTDASGITRGGNRLAAVGLTGHVCDITMGMVLLPISRHSALASFFKISVSTTLTNHTLTAYTLFILVTIHGLLYASWVAVFNSLSTKPRKVIPVLNPTYQYSETWPGNDSSLGVWRASLIFTGCFAALIMLALSITTLPRVRARNFNLFYFTHLFSILMVIVICLHASTMFYCTSPGLAMWILDWGMRLHELRRNLDGTIAAVGKGWYCVTLPLPRSRLTGCSCRSPLAHFYLHHANSSIRELHPFTTITHLASRNNATHPLDDDFPIQFLFRKQGKPLPESDIAQVVTPLPIYRRLLRGKKGRVRSAQWTAKLAGLADQKAEPAEKDGSLMAERLRDGSLVNDPHSIPVRLRLEGPYFSPADPHRYDTVVCMVAGTGISGALAIASAFNHVAPNDAPPSGTTRTQSLRRWRRCIIIWSVKADDDIALPFLEPMAHGLELRKFLTGGGRQRVDLPMELRDITEDHEGHRCWVYISGPDAFISGAKEACREIKEGGRDLDVYAASWSI